MAFKIRLTAHACLRRNFRHQSSASPVESAKGTIDSREVEKLSKLSTKWWDEGGELIGLHSMNKLRVQLVRDCLRATQSIPVESENQSQPLAGYNIIDVGCGGGILAEPLARLGANVTGLDASKDLIQVAKAHAEQQEEIAGKIEYILGSIEQLAENRRESYDAVVASEVLEHVVQKDLFLESCTGVLKPGGSIFITTLNKTMLAWVAGVITAEYVLKLVPPETHDWDKFVEPRQVELMLEKYGCHTKLVHGLFYNFMCNEWMWTKSTDINYALHAIKKK